MALPLETHLGIPVVEAVLGETRLRMFIDTGAKVSYLRAGLAGAYPLVRTVRDFYPGFGVFETELHAVPLVLGDQVVTLECGTLPPLLEMMLPLAGVQGILGTDLLKSFVVEWSAGFGELRLRGYAA